MAYRRGYNGQVCERTSTFAGVNIFDVLWEAEPGQGGNLTSSIMNIRSVSESFGNITVIVRFFASLWGPYHSYWYTNKKKFWNVFDNIMSEFESHDNLYLIPSIGYTDWHIVSNKVINGTNETLNDYVKNETSISRTLCNNFFREIVSRYKDKDKILMWELGNELNLHVNLPPPHCGDTNQPCFSNHEMVSLLEDLVQIIRSIDDRRPISSGLSAPRNTAWHMEHCTWPGNKTCPFWSKVDSKAQWLEMLTYQNQANDVWSIHHYENKDVCYFETCTNNASIVVETAANESLKHDAFFYLGEYGGPNPNFTGPSVENQSFPFHVLSFQQEFPSALPLSTIWAWACPSHRSDMTCIYPNSTVPKESGSNRMLQRLIDANQHYFFT